MDGAEKRETYQELSEDGLSEVQTVVSKGEGDTRSVGRKDDVEKSRLDLLPPLAIMAVGDVLRHGAEKYGADNWQNVPDLRARYAGAALRHIFQAMDAGKDPDSGLPHLAHAVCSILFVLEDQLRGGK